MEINKKWLDAQLKDLNVDNCVLVKAGKFKNLIEDIVFNKISSSKWTLIEFFILSIATHIAEELLSDHRYQFASNDNQVNLRQLNQTDVEIIIKKYQQYYYEKLILLSQLSKSKGMIGAYPAIEWVELIISAKEKFYISKDIIFYKIPDDKLLVLEIEIKSSGTAELIDRRMAEEIRFHHYSLDSNLAREEIFPIQWLDLTKSAEFINLSPDQLIAECFQNNFGPYVKLGIFEFKVHYAFTVNEGFIKEVWEPSYPYSYKGLVRLLKETNTFSSVETSFRAFYQGSDIYVDSTTDYTLIRLQPSLAEAIQGITRYIKLNKKQKITRDHLVFLKHELEEVKATLMKNQHSTSNSQYIPELCSNDQEEKQSRTHVLHELIKEIYATKKKITNLEMWNYLRQLGSKDHHIVQEVTSWTINDAYIGWCSETRLEQKMLKKSFLNFMATLRNSK